MVSVPVAQDTSGQSARTEQASKARVTESPTAATEPGETSHRDVGLGVGFGAGFRDGPAEDVFVEGSPALQPYQCPRAQQGRRRGGDSGTESASAAHPRPLLRRPGG